LAQPITSCVAAINVVPLKPARLTNEQKAKFKLTERQQEILAGCLLGDLNIEKQNINARLQFKQSTIHKDYMLNLYEEFEELCPAEPKTISLAPNKITGKTTPITFSLLKYNKKK